MKSDKKRSDRKKTNKEKTNKEKNINEKTNMGKTNKEELDREKSDSDVKMPDREGPELKEPDVGMHEAEDGQRPSDSKKLETEDDEEDGIEKVNENAEVDGAEKIDRAPEANDIENAAGAERAGDTEEEGSQGKNLEEDSAVQAGSGFDDQEEEGEDWENDDLQDDWEEESEPSRPWVMALVFLGMIFAAACICVMLWSFTHTDKQEENKNVIAGAAVTPGNGDISAPNGTTPSGTGNLPLGNQEGNTAAGSDHSESDTPDLNKVTTQDGRVIIFMECDDMVTPKEYVNLRTEPSTSRGEATVGCRLNNGEVAHRTGISEEMGWSRVEYNDQVLYVVSSFVNVVTDSQAAE